MTDSPTTSAYYFVSPVLGIAEPASAFSHLFAALVFTWLSVLLLRRTTGSSSKRRGMRVYCSSVVTLLIVSGMYHLFSRDLVIRDVLQRIDHASIFIVIAATFTPIHLALFENAWRWAMLAVVWSLAGIGVLLSLLFLKSVPENVCLTFYLGLGWIGLVSGSLLFKRFGFAFILPLLLGALAYTAGAVGDFLHYPVLINRVIGPHEVFHFAVIAGMSFHWKFISGFAHRTLAQCHETRAFLLVPQERRTAD
ncbi:MAG: hemolysin III family protein [Bdellovibrionota bacterium]